MRLPKCFKSSFVIYSSILSAAQGLPRSGCALGINSEWERIGLGMAGWRLVS